MRKTMIFAAVAALISLASCQKEEAINNGTDRNASPVFTASISGATRTTIDMTEGKVAWEATDEITVTDASYASAVYTIESIDATTGKATFVIKTGETAIGDGPYTASYGTEPATAQTYSATAGKLYMTAPETSNNSFTFTVQCGLMKLNLTKTGESVKIITVTGTPTGGSETTYTLTCDPAQSIASAKDFFIALPDGSYKKIEITNASDIKCTLNSTNGVTVEANHIKPITFGESKIKFAPAIPDGALAGVFSVSATKKVHFSQGNLYYDGSKFNFEANQYGFYSSYQSTYVSHFYWSQSVNSAIAEEYDRIGRGSDVFFTNVDGFKVNVGGTEQTGWRTLSTNEWQYLFNTRENADTKYGFATVGNVTGIILLPDTFTDPMKNGGSGAFVPKSTTGWTANTYTTGGDWEAMESAGAVFLPAAGSRNGSSVYCVGDYGLYWSSTVLDGHYAYSVYFDSYDVFPDYRDGRSSGVSVRLITESK